MIKIAIVGCGAIGNRHAKWATKYGLLVAVCDIKKDRADKLAKEYGCKSYKDIIEMLCNCGMDVDLVAICTPNGLHADHTIAALDFGYNVLCEKPMALTTADCEAMIDTAEKVNKRLFIVKQNRFNSPVQLVKNLIDQGKLGRILSVHLSCVWNRNDDYFNNSDWKGTVSEDGGILYTQFSHFIDLLYFLVGDIDKVYSMAKNFLHEETAAFPDTVVTAFNFANGALGTGHFTINSHGKNMEGSLILICEKGTIKIGGQYLNTIEYQDIEGDTYYVPANENNCNEYGTYKGSSSKHDEVYKNVVATLQGDGTIMTGMLDGLKTVQIIRKIYEACE